MKGLAILFFFNLEHLTQKVLLFRTGNECAKVIIQAGIEEVVYMSDKYHNTNTCRASRRMFELAGIKTRKHKPERRKITIDFGPIVDGMS